jgi:DNA-3-methyladenine glycosylase
VIAVREADGSVTRASIVETEAYEPGDPASHAFGGRTPRNGSMFGPPGTLYVYLIYGVHHCCNVVTGPAGVASAVLLRAAEPLEGIDLMRSRRPGATDRDLCRGPGRLASALAITRAADGVDLLAGERIWLERGRMISHPLASPRVGISTATARPWRFSEPGSPFVSRPVPRATVRSAGRP